jgi:nucleoside-diphosphate-sugar epimerase
LPRTAKAQAVISEVVARSGDMPPLITRYVVASTCRDFSFTRAKAARDFGYEPIVSLEQAQAETIAWLRQSGWAHTDGSR